MRGNSWLLAALAAATPASAGGFGAEPPKPAMTVAKGFKWKDPFSSPALADFTASCTTSIKLRANEFTLHEMKWLYPRGLWEWFNSLQREFGKLEYPGAWQGEDWHGSFRTILTMELEDVPERVRHWVDAQKRSSDPASKESKGLFLVYEKKKTKDPKEMINAPANSIPDSVQGKERTEAIKKRIMIFAPGALYRILPLFAADSASPECAGEFSCFSFLHQLRYLI